jgi:hypothetical protein
MSARVQGVEIGPAINAEQHGFAIEDDGGVAVTQRGLRGSLPGVQFNAHLTHCGDVVFEHACKAGGVAAISQYFLSGSRC